MPETPLPFAPADQDYTGLEIAIIGMEARVPGAATLNAFWQNLCAGTESFTRFSDADLDAFGVAPELRGAPDFVPVGAPLEHSNRFDAGFFGFSPSEAEILDPQHRLFLQSAWNALENAGYAPNRYEGAIGVYAAAGMNGYLRNLYGNSRIRASVTPYEIFTSNDKDFLATRTAYKLNLRGPGITVQTACSSSLVAVHLAAQSLIAGECDMALAGGVSLSRQEGYRALEGSILSPDGQCRAFDAQANGTVTANGLGVVVLKRLEDALADGDRVDAVIKGSAINNDGANKASYTAPQVDSQAEVVAAAQAVAEISADDISYIEAHGTGTNLGDPIEIAALTKAFRRSTERKGDCAIGSVKTNIGHLDTAAGVVGMIKTALMLRHRQIPASLHFTTPNPRINFADSPFVVNTELRHWESTPPRRAGVSSFGIGGTNAHVVLEEAPVTASTPPIETPQLLVLSAKTPTALAKRTAELASHLERNAQNRSNPQSLSDMAYTLCAGREALSHRLSISARSTEEAIRALRRAPTGTLAVDSTTPILLFPGQGSQSPAMLQDLYAENAPFKTALDACAAILDAQFEGGFLTQLFAADDRIHQTALAQPALFAVEYALAQVWLALGLRPRALHGHSLGEYVAATLAGIFDLEAALKLVCARGAHMQAAEAGSMLAVIHGTENLDALIGRDVAVAAYNAPGFTVLSGPSPAIQQVKATLDSHKIAYRPLQTSHAFHSPMMAQAAQALDAELRKIQLCAPQIPVISNLTGDWLTDAQATDPAYWTQHLLSPVQFAKGTETLMALQNPVFIECGPSHTLANLTRQNGAVRVIPGLATDQSDLTGLLNAIGAAWSAGLTLDWTALMPETSRRVELPGYPFDDQRYWVEPDEMAGLSQVPVQPPSLRSDDPGDWIYSPVWRRTPLTTDLAKGRSSWLIFDDGRMGKALAQQLERSGADAYRVEKGASFAEQGYRAFTQPAVPGTKDDVLLHALSSRGLEPENIVFLWGLGSEDFTDAPRRLQNLIDTLATNPRPIQLTVITCGGADVTGSETLSPPQAALHGIAMVAGQEYPWLGSRVIDLDPEATGKPADIAAYLHQALATSGAPALARRAQHNWQLDFAQHPVAQRDSQNRLRRNGCFVILGHLAAGFGRIWLQGLQSVKDAKIALIEDSAAAPLGETKAAVHLNADCTDPDALQSALSQIKRQFGRIDGVFLSVALSNSDVTAPLTLLRENQWQNAERNGPRLLNALRDALSHHKVGFVCIQSSLSAIVGGVGLAAYAGAHHYADVFAGQHNRDSRTDWYAINWDALQTDLSSSAIPGHSVLQENALSEAEAWESTRRIIEAGLTGQTIVSRSDLAARRERWLNPEPTVEQGDDADTSRARPDLDTPFVAPRNDVETKVAAVLQNILGLEDIGVDDGFFELGGHSLMAIRATAELRDMFSVQVEMRELLYENPSTASIAKVIQSKLPDSHELDAMQALLAEVENLSDEELSDALAEADLT